MREQAYYVLQGFTQTFDSLTVANCILKQSCLMFFVVKYLHYRAWKCPEALGENNKPFGGWVHWRGDGGWANIVQGLKRYGSTDWKDQSFGQDDILYFLWPISFYVCNTPENEEEQNEFCSS